MLKITIPELLDTLPVDPYDRDGRPLRFVRMGDEFVVYSVGADGEDGGGRPLDRDKFGRPLPYGDGDLWLDTLFLADDEKTGNVQPTK